MTWDMLNWSEDLFDQFPKMCRQRFDDGSIFVPIALVQTVRRSFDRGLHQQLLRSCVRTSGRRRVPIRKSSLLVHDGLLGLRVVGLLIELKFRLLMSVPRTVINSVQASFVDLK